MADQLSTHCLVTKCRKPLADEKVRSIRGKFCMKCEQEARERVKAGMEVIRRHKASKAMAP